MNEREHLGKLMIFLQANRKATLDKATGAFSFGALVTYFHGGKPKWQTMRYDLVSNHLIVRGTSPKMGAYAVTIAALPRE